MQCVSSEYWVSRKGLFEEVTFKTLGGKKKYRNNMLRVFWRKKNPK